MQRLDGRNNDLDVFEQYVLEASWQPKLSKEEEEELINKILEGVTATRKSKRKRKKPNPKLEQRLREQVQDGERARQRLIEVHLGMVIAMAKSSHFDLSRVSISDLVQAGNIGLMEAVPRFDPRRPNRFATYASSWIKKYMVQEYQQFYASVKLPENKLRLISLKNKLDAQLNQQLGRSPNNEELAEAIATTKHCNSAKAKKLLNAAIQVERSVLSLDFPIGDGTKSTLADVIVDKSVMSIDNSLENMLRSERLQAALATLTKQEELVMSCLYVNETNQEEVANELQITPGRVRQLELAALKKLRRPSRSNQLRDVA